MTPAPTTPTRKPVSVSDLYDAGEKMIALAEGGGPLAAAASAAVVRVAKAIVGLNPDAVLTLAPPGEDGSMALIKASFRHPRRLFA